MKKEEAIKEARVGALMQGGTWYVTRRGKEYNYMHADRYEGSSHGRVAEMFTPEKVRRTLPPSDALEKSIDITALRDSLKDAVRWLDAIEAGIGNHTLVNLMPNGCLGRNDMRRALEQTRPESSTEKLNSQLRESIAAEPDNESGR